MTRVFKITNVSNEVGHSNVDGLKLVTILGCWKKFRC